MYVIIDDPEFFKKLQTYKPEIHNVVFETLGTITKKSGKIIEIDDITIELNIKKNHIHITNIYQKQ